ncbi:dTDP-4-dehydrorhamnose 3,5-epimerase [Orenia marismortui]|uniref:dTDP-4-dehydrorhamnose 3,5-epimerase n=1 Tax=Orenia marismortui TaxID=46469 RepID=A0A4R8HHP2_9FIRM|nr:dTDP-4-dehydrorhamnose 3,5-epimerase [Orenia marismortui]TDX58928.1 dTDP-4-dehydrorhamnose 3,5-epimerase [Orenia marismortui]
MSKFKRIETDIKDLYVIEPTIFGDHRGFFMEFYNKRDFLEMGLDINFVQDNHSKSKRGTLRGLHFQAKHPQGKLVRSIKGSVYDVAVDLREESETYGQYFGVVLSEDNKKMFYIPEGFAHGFVALTEEAEFMYKTTDYYYPEYEAGIIWSDSDISINWPLVEYGLKEEELIMSERDKNLPTLKEYSNTR